MGCLGGFQNSKKRFVFPLNREIFFPYYRKYSVPRRRPLDFVTYSFRTVCVGGYWKYRGARYYNFRTGHHYFDKATRNNRFRYTSLPALVALLKIWRDSLAVNDMTRSVYAGVMGIRGSLNSAKNIMQSHAIGEFFSVP